MSNIIRVFTKSNLKVNELEIYNTHYICNVMRRKVGDNIILINGTNQEYFGTISEINKKFVKISEIKCIRKSENKQQLGLIFPMIQKIDIMLKMATELGVTEFISYKSQYSQVKFNFDRIEKNIIEAIEQSERLDFPTIHNKQKNINEIFNKLSEEDTIVILCEERNKDNAKLIKNDLNNKNIYIIVGPEGGFGKNEIDEIKNYKFVKTISLGQNILRTETAMASALSIINFLR